MAEVQVSGLADRVVVVTGAASGIGRAIALEAGERGAAVVLADVSDAGEAVAAELGRRSGNAMFIRCDVAKADDVERMIDVVGARFGALDVLINNAGIADSQRRLDEVELDVWDRVLAVNLRGAFLCSKYALPYLMASTNGSIINVASMFGMTGAPGAGPYSASKGGLIGLTRQLAVDYGPDGVRVNAICPGYVDTDMGGRRAAYSEAQRADANARRDAHAALQPIGRQARPDEIAEVALFLASEASSFITGAILPVDGGCTATFNRLS